MGFNPSSTLNASGFTGVGSGTWQAALAWSLGEALETYNCIAHRPASRTSQPQAPVDALSSNLGVPLSGNGVSCTCTAHSRPATPNLSSKKSANLRKGAQDKKRGRRAFKKAKSAVQEKWPKTSDKRRRSLLAKAKDVEKTSTELVCDPWPGMPSQGALRTLFDDSGE